MLSSSIRLIRMILLPRIWTVTLPQAEDISRIAADLPDGETDLPGLGRSNTLACGRGANGADLSGRNAHLLRCRLRVFEHISQIEEPHFRQMIVSSTI